jgi:hypothetical protein
MLLPMSSNVWSVPIPPRTRTQPEIFTRRRRRLVAIVSAKSAVFELMGAQFLPFVRD